MDYTTLIASQHRDRTKFAATVAFLTSAAQDVGDVLLALPEKFDVDTAEGVQLDDVGRWVGQGRSVSVPLENVYFSVDIVGLGFGEGYLIGPFDPLEGLVLLPDAGYRALLKAIIAANYWDGTNESLWALSSTALSDYSVNPLIVDGFDMTYSVILTELPEPIYLEIVRKNYLPPKPAGVLLTGIYLMDGPMFGLDFDTTLIAGFDEGGFPAPT